MENLKYIIVSENVKNVKEIELLQKAYSLWKEIWQPILKDKFTADAFSRQKYYCLLLDSDNVVAMTFSSTFNIKLDSTWDHSYFKNFTDNTRDLLVKANIENMSTYESLTVHPSYRKKNISSLMIKLGAMFFQSNQIGHLICPAMRINGVNNLCKNIGFEVLSPDTKYKGHSIDLLYISNNTEIKSTMPLFYKLWKSRLDLTKDQVTPEQEHNLKTAA